MNMFALNTQRFPAGRQNVHLRGLLENALRQRRRGLDHVLAAIEDQQHPFAAEETYQTEGWIRGLNRQPERRGHRARDEKRIVEWSKIKKLNGAGKLGKQLITYRNSNGGLADAARSHDGDKALGLQLLRYFLNGQVAPYHSCREGRKIMGLTGLRGHRLQGSWRTRTRDRRHETIALPRECGQIPGSGLTIAKCLAKGGDMDAEATLVDRDTRPDPRHQIVLADNLARLLDQNDQDIERAAANMKRDTFPFDQPLRRVQPKRTERNDFV